MRDIITLLKTSGDLCLFLSNDEAGRRLGVEGYNEFPGSKRGGVFDLVKKVIMEPMFLIFISCGVIYFFGR